MANPEVELPLGWVVPDAEEADLLYAELMRELPPGHLLDGVAVEVVLTAEGVDDVLFRHVEASDRFTVVHLTYLGQTEISPKFPTVEFDGTWNEFLEREHRLWDTLGNIGDGSDDQTS